MAEEDSSRLRIRLPNGAELEASGSPDFVRAERDAFLAAHSQSPRHSYIKECRGDGQETAGRSTEHGGHELSMASNSPDWAAIIESKGPEIQLRAKLKGDGSDTDEEACLVLLSAAQRFLNISKPTAAQLARWLRASGYPVQRVDRALAVALSKGDILASGSRRARRYELTGPGKIKANLLALELAQLIAGRA